MIIHTYRHCHSKYNIQTTYILNLGNAYSRLEHKSTLLCIRHAFSVPGITSWSWIACVVTLGRLEIFEMGFLATEHGILPVFYVLSVEFYCRICGGVFFVSFFFLTQQQCSNWNLKRETKAWHILYKRSVFLCHNATVKSLDLFSLSKLFMSNKRFV